MQATPRKGTETLRRRAVCIQASDATLTPKGDVNFICCTVFIVFFLDSTHTPQGDENS